MSLTFAFRGIVSGACADAYRHRTSIQLKIWQLKISQLKILKVVMSETSAAA